MLCRADYSAAPLRRSSITRECCAQPNSRTASHVHRNTETFRLQQQTVSGMVPQIWRSNRVNRTYGSNGLSLSIPVKIPRKYFRWYKFHTWSVGSATQCSQRTELIPAHLHKVVQQAWRSSLTFIHIYWCSEHFPKVTVVRNVAGSIPDEVNFCTRPWGLLSL
jgi:hypothetical protein